VVEPQSRGSRLLVAVSACSLAAVLLAYFLAPDQRARVWIANLSWIWSSAYAAACAVWASRRLAHPQERAAWAWIAAGCGMFLFGQLAWSAHELILRKPPPYPSLADAGFLGVYPFLLVAVLGLWRVHPRRPADIEVGIDALLVTYTTGALTYEFLLEPLYTVGGSPLELATSTAWAVGGILVLWLILIQMLYRTKVPRGGAGLVLLAVALHSVTNVLYARRAVAGSYASGSVLDLGWDIGLLLVATAAALAPARDSRPSAPALPTQTLPLRVVAIGIGLFGVALLSLRGALSLELERDVIVLLIAGLAIIGIRVLYSLQSDRRYAEMLEREVARQTRTLMDSLAATAATERSLRLVMESVPDAIAVVDRTGRVLDRNAQAASMLGLGLREGSSAIDFALPEARHTVRENLEAAFEGEVRRFEVPFIRADGMRRTASILYAPVREGQEIPKVLVLARDITDHLRTGAQLQQAEKLAAMGQLVSGVAHEINNPAAIISGFAQTLLLDDLRTDHRDMVQMMYDEATRIGRITSNLLAFARAGGRERMLVDVNDIVRRTFALRSYHLSTLNIGVRLELDPDEPKVWGNGSELQQMLLNLLINAEQALMTADGTRSILLRTRATETEVLIQCADSGPGVPLEIRDRIFDPFFTTKPEGVGTGLGLSICYGIARDHNGRISLESDGGGATFSVTLPRDPRTESRPARESPRPRSAAPPEPPISVLLIDDEAGLRAAVAKYLNRRGIQCRAVGDGSEALEVLRNRDFDVIVSDVRMPGMNGREFLERLREDRPELVSRLIFSTGDTFAAETAALLRDSGVPSLIKPFDFERLEAVLRVKAARVSA
jgi:PAS domain S-box-containing protein